jgi:hypothetical protein
MNPSLLLIPDRYKAAKLYSQIPDSGAGDLTFARNSNATRVNSAGLIEKVRTNLLLHSEEFTTANGWGAGVIGASTASQTSNYGIAPNGTNTADRIQLALNGESYADWVRPTSGFDVGQSYTYSIYLKSLTGSTTLEFFNDGAVGVNKTITTEWVRYTHSFTATAATIYPRFLLVPSTSSTADLLAWGYQIETGDITTPYIPTTTAAVSVGITADIPRLDYTGGGCPSLLLEPQRTNLITFSEQFNNAAWFTEDLSVTANNVVSPDGFINADLLVPNTSNIDHTIYQIATAAVSQTFSVFAKAGGYNFIFLGANNGVASDGVFFNLTNGTISQNTSVFTAKIESYGNGWYRCSISAASWPLIYAIICTSANGTSFIHAGNGTSGVYAWGAQLELGSYVSSYIPTLGSSVTRLADAASKTGISSLIGQTEGVLYAEVDINVKEEAGTPVVGIFALNVNAANGDNAIFIGINRGATNQIYGVVNSSGVNQVIILSGNISSGLHKVALAYKANDFALFVDGVLVDSDVSGSVPATSQVLLSQRFNGDTVSLNDRLRDAAIYTTRLSNSELATLTAL